MSVRSRDPVWLHWIYDSGEGRTKKMRCRYCMENVQLCSAVRCRKHLITCHKSPMVIKQYFISSRNESKSSRRWESTTLNEKDFIDLSVEMNENNVSDGNSVSHRLSEASSVSLGLSDSSSVSRPLSGVNVASQSLSEANVGSQGLYEVHNTLADSNHSLVQISDDDEELVSSGASVASSTRGRTPVNVRSDQHKLGSDDLTDLFAKAMITGDVPFGWADNHFLKLFFGKLDSTFALPSGDDLSGAVLNRIHELCRSEVAAKIESSKDLSIVAVLTDAGQKKFDLNIMLCSLESIWYKTAQLDSGSLKPQALSKYLESAIRDIGVTKTSAIVTHSNTKLDVAKGLVCKQWPHIIPIDCAARALHLLLSDICRLGSLNEILVTSKSVFVEFGVSEILMEKYREEWVKFTSDEQKNGRKMVEVSLRLDCDNRWVAIRDMLTELQRARPVLSNLAAGKESQLSVETKGTIENDAFWVKIDLALKFVEPLVNAVTTFDNDTAVISEVVEIYSTIEELFQDASLKESMFTYSEKEKAKRCFRNRLLGKCVNEYHYLANFLDPNYRGRSFEGNETLLVVVMTTLEKYAKHLGLLNSPQDKYELSECLSKFRNREGVFGLTLLSSKCAATYWKHLTLYPSCKRLALLATKILSIPASSRNAANIMLFKERQLSDYSSVHCKQKLDKLIMSKWVLERHVRETNEMLQEMQLVSNSSSLPTSLEEDVFRNSRVLKDFLKFESPFTLEQLSSNGDDHEAGT